MDFDSMTHEAILKEIGERVQQRRLNKNLSQGDLAQLAGVSRRAVHLLESGRSTTLTTLLGVLRGLNALAEIENFLPATQVSPIQLAKLQGRVRQRASRKRKPK